MSEYTMMPLAENVEEMFIGPFGSSLKNDCFVDEDASFCMVYEQKHAIQKTMDVETRFVDEKKYNELKRFNIHGGDIIVSCRGTIGETFVVPEDAPLGIMHPSIMKIRLKDGIYDKFYFNLLLQKRLKGHEAEANGSGIKMAISAKALGAELFPVPTMKEQKQITDVISKVQSIIEARQMDLMKLDNLIKARFVEMFGKPIDNTMKWPIDRAENLCILVTDGSHFSPKACEEGYPMLSVKDMRQNGFDYSDCKLVDDETFKVLKKQGCVPQVDDVLIAKDGSYFTRAFPITEYKDQAILSSIGMYRPDLEKILPRFLASYLMTNEVVEFVNRGYVTGTALRRVIIKGLKNIPVYMPPIELQKQFVEFAEQVDKSKVVVQLERR